MNPDATHNPYSPYAVQRRKGFRGLKFASVLEDDFRRNYARYGVNRARLMPAFAIVMALIAMVARLFAGGSHLVMLIFDLGFYLPLLFCTLYASTLPDRYKVYQGLLALSGLVSGVVVASIVFRAAERGIPYYFSMETGWIFVCWLILGLRFRVAAATALSISAVHVASLFYLEYDLTQASFEILMLLLVNAIGAVSCYQLEYAARRSYLESKEIEQLADELEELAGQDALTGLHNRRSFDTYIDRVWRQSRREMAPITIIFIDLDHFKDYNDHYGHQAGDDALKSVGDVISGCAQRPFDLAARYGGEEFVVVLYGNAGESEMVVDSSRAIAEKIRKGIHARRIKHEKSSAGPYLTASVGVSVIMPGAERSMQGAIQLADESLYQAKEMGKNCIVVQEAENTQMLTGQFRRNGQRIA